MDEQYIGVCPKCAGEGEVDMNMTPVFEVVLEPKNPKSPIKQMILRVDSPEKYYDLDTVLTYIEDKFPDWKAEHVISGFKQVDTIQ